MLVSCDININRLNPLVSPFSALSKGVEDLITGAAPVAQLTVNTNTSLKEDPLTRAVGIAKDVFESAGVFKENHDIVNIISSYMPFEAVHIRDFFPSRSLFPSFVNLSDSAVLKSHLAPSFQEEEGLSIAMKFVQRSYEIAPYFLRKDQQYGFAFPLDSEPLSYAMQYIKSREDVTACEIGCAKGEIGLLLACAGANRVIFNDLDEDSIAILEGLIKQLPSQARKVCNVDKGNCLGLLERNPKLENQVDLIICRNVIHFFNNQQQASLLEIIKKMLKPGGQAIFTTNSVYSYGEIGQKLDQSEESSFNLIQGFVHDRDKNPRSPSFDLFAELRPCADTLTTGTQFKDYYIYERDKCTNMEWKADKKEFKKLDPTIQAKIKEQIQIKGKRIAQIQRGSVRVVSMHPRFYNPISLSKLFKDHEFNILEVFLVNRKGHLVPFSDALKGQQIGIIVSKSLEK